MKLTSVNSKFATPAVRSRRVLQPLVAALCYCGLTAAGHAAQGVTLPITNPSEELVITTPQAELVSCATLESPAARQAVSQGISTCVKYLDGTVAPSQTSLQTLPLVLNEGELTLPSSNTTPVSGGAVRGTDLTQPSKGASATSAGSSNASAEEDDPILQELLRQDAARRASVGYTEEKVSSSDAQAPKGYVPDNNFSFSVLPQDQEYQNTHLVTPQERESGSNRGNPLTYAEPLNAADYLPVYRFMHEDRKFWWPLKAVYDYIFSVRSETVTQNEQIAPLKYVSADYDDELQGQQALTGTALERFLSPANIRGISFDVQNGDFVTRVVGLGDLAFQTDHQSDSIYAQLAKNIKDAISTINPSNADGSIKHHFAINHLVESAAQGLGFYNLGFSVRLEGKKLFVVDVKPANVTTIKGNSQIIVRGQGTGFSPFQELENHLPATGQAINIAKYEDTKSYLNNLAQAYGYFDAEFDEHKLVIDRNSQQVQWILDFYTGSRYKLNNITFEGGKIREKTLANMLNFTSGDYYSEQDVNDSISSYQSTRYFNLVNVETSINNTNKTVDLKYKFEESLPNSLEWSLGYDTTEGFRTKALYTRNYVNSLGAKGDVDFYLSRLKQEVDFTYKHPSTWKPTVLYYSASSSFNRTYQSESLGYSKNLGASLSLSYLPVNSWTFSGSFNLRRDLWFANDQGFNKNLAYWNVLLARSSLKTGVTINLSSNKFLSALSTQGLLYKAWQVRAWRIQDLTDKVAVRLGLGLGKIYTNDFHSLAPSLRYYAGGANSIRGFAYQSLSEHNGVKDQGGSALTEMSFEYQHEIIPNLKGVVFFDAGKASDNIDFKNLNYGTGVGIRYYLPVGYAAFDIAYPLHTKFSWRNFAFYIGVNTQF